MTPKAVFFDAGNTILSLDYAVIVDALRQQGILVDR